MGLIEVEAILYVGHGSRLTAATKEAVAFLEETSRRIPISIQEISFLELSEPTIEQGIKRCVERGATHIVVIPVLLLTAGHAKHDIPRELNKAKVTYPNVSFSYGSPIGVHNKIIDVLEDRVNEQSAVEKDRHVLLVGRGSSDQDQIQEIYRIADLLEKRRGIKKVETCFLAAAHPSFEEGLEKVAASGSEPVFVVPYLLFTGLLMQRMKRKINGANKGGGQFLLCNYLGYHPYLQDVLIEKVEKCLRIEMMSK
jgi:sirohydrochlorin ferrochelatase